MLSPARVVSADATIEVAVDRPVAQISRNLYGHLAENLGAVVYGGVWVGEGSAIPNIGGIRKALVDEMRRLHVPVVRFPGGCYAESYDWRDGVGPQSERRTRTSHWASSVPAGAPDAHRYDPNEFGTTEFLRFCRLTGSAPYLVANIRSLPALALHDWVDYCNAPAHATTWSRARAASGDADTYGVRYWGIGNEAWACGGGFTADEYALEFRRYTIGLPQHDTPLSLIASGPYKSDYAWTAQFFEGIARRGGRPAESIFGLALHDYTWNLSRGRTDDFDHGRSDAVAFDEVDWYELLRKGDQMDARIEGHWAVMAEHDPQHHVKLVVDEWGPWYRDGSAQTQEHLFEQTPTLRDALFTAMTLDTFNRHADKVAMANCSQLINCLNSPFLAQGENFCVTPVGHVFAMYAAHQDGVALGTDVAAPDVEYQRDGQRAQFWGLRGSASLHNRMLVVTVANPHVAEARETNIRIRGGARVHSGVATTLTSSDIRARNTFARPDAVVPQQLPFSSIGSTVSVTFPAASVTKLTLTLE
jgi:alpha-N-arabinofuranosidase